MINRLFKQNLINKSYIILFFLTIIFVIFSFVLLINQRINTALNTNYDNYFIGLAVVFLIFLLYFFLSQILPFVNRVRKKNITTFNNRFSLYFIGIAITPAIIVGSIALLLINFGVNDWFNDRIQNIIKNSVYVAEGYLEEHKKTIKGDIYAMSSDLNDASNLYIRDKFNFEKLFFTQSLVRNLPDSFLIDGKGNVILKSRGTLKVYYQPTPESLDKVANGELAIFTSTEFNKVYAIIKLDKYLDLYLYVGRPMDNRVLTALNDTRSAQNDFNRLEENRSKLSVIFILIYLIITMVLIFISIIVGIGFARKIVDPITKIIIATDNISKGNYDSKLSKTNDFVELNRLTDSFNKMSEDIVSQRKQLAISEKHEAWSDVARKIAHEIKNPLTPIKLSIDRLKNKTNKGINISKSEVVETIDTINRQVDDIKNLVDEFSNFARMPAPNMHECNIKNIIENVVSLFDLEKNKIFIDYNKKSLDCHVNCDESQINRVFNNLIINSIHSIEAKFKNKLGGKIFIDGNVESKYIKIKIFDNGQGLAHKEAELLKPYFSTKDKNIGTGLGLSIVEKIISEHEGNFHIYNIDNESGACSEFTLRLHNER
ncbi:ATP-binding protein [Pelagibacteraceae bacterium]|nr:ATP-binding protein [Pelagibacteraceae bacterium]